MTTQIAGADVCTGPRSDVEEVGSPMLTIVDRTGRQRDRRDVFAHLVRLQDQGKMTPAAVVATHRQTAEAFGLEVIQVRRIQDQGLRAGWYDEMLGELRCRRRKRRAKEVSDAR